MIAVASKVDIFGSGEDIYNDRTITPNSYAVPKSPVMSKKEVSDLLEQLYRQAQIQFGSAVKSRWMYDGDGCPGCGREIDTMKYRGKKALSLNAFIFREHGVLIAYLLCGRCANEILQESKSNPFGPTPLHAVIERNLKEAFVKHLGH